jgi:hypothetical protein
MIVSVTFFQRLSQDSLATFANNVVTLMSSDAQFSTLSEDIKVLKTRSEAYNLALSNKINGGRIATIEKNKCMKELLDQLVNVALLVDALSNGSEVIVLSAGFNVRSTPTPISSLDVPSVIKIENEKTMGQISIQLEKVKGAVIYGIEKRILVEGQPEGTWTNGDYISSSKTKVGGFEPATRYEIRLRAIGTKGMVSGWSLTTTLWIS